MADESKEPTSVPVPEAPPAPYEKRSATVVHQGLPPRLKEEKKAGKSKEADKPSAPASEVK